MSNASSQPSAEIRIGKARLDIGFGEQQELRHRVKDLVEELVDNPMAKPDRPRTILKGIRLRPRQGNQPGSYLSIEATEPKKGRPTAAIGVTDKSKSSGHDVVGYYYRHELDIWEEWRPGLTEPSRMVSGNALVDFLDSQLPTSALEGLIDTKPDGMTIVHMLASHLHRSASVRTSNEIYSAERVAIGGEDYTSSINTELNIRGVNGRTIHSLAVAAKIQTDYGLIGKTYRFDTVYNGEGAPKTSDGRVEISGFDSAPQVRLDAFAQRDQVRNHPLDSLNAGVDRLREAYKFPE